MECIEREFLRIGSSTSDSPYGRPRLKTVRLLRTLCASSREVARALTQSGLMRSVISQFVGSKCTIDLTIDALLLWRTLAVYGLSASLFMELFEPLSQLINTPCATAIFYLFEALVHPASDPDQTEPPNALSFSQIAPLVDMASHHIIQGIIALDSSIPAACHFLASYFLHIPDLQTDRTLDSFFLRQLKSLIDCYALLNGRILEDSANLTDNFQARNFVLAFLRLSQGLYGIGQRFDNASATKELMQTVLTRQAFSSISAGRRGTLELNQRALFEQRCDWLLQYSAVMLFAPFTPAKELCAASAALRSSNQLAGMM